MATIKKYKAFDADLQGYLKVPVGDFRSRLLPLVKNRAWSDADVEYVRQLATDGGGYALQRLFGEKHSAAKKALGAAQIPPMPMHKDKLDADMRGLIASCDRAAWTFDNYATYQAYLDSTLSPAQLDVKLRQQDADEALGDPASASASSSTSAVVASAAQPAEADHFTAAYRAAHPAYQTVVKEHFTAAALAARRRASSATKLIRGTQQIL